jgi:hypothetical protein
MSIQALDRLEALIKYSESFRGDVYGGRLDLNKVMFEVVG